MMNINYKWLNSSTIILAFGGEKMVVLSELSFLLFCQPRETGQGASSSHNPQSFVSDCGKRELNTHYK